MPVLGEELGDGDLALPGSHLDGRDGGLDRGSGGGLGRGGCGRLGCRRGGWLGTTRFTARSGQWRSRWLAYTPHISTCFVIGRYLAQTQPLSSCHLTGRDKRGLTGGTWAPGRVPRPSIAFVDRYSVAFLVQLPEGIRVGEAQALQRGDVDFNRGRIHIARTVSTKGFTWATE